MANFKALLQSLLSSFYSKQDQAEIVDLMNLDFSAALTLASSNVQGAAIQNFTASVSGIVISYLDNDLMYNGIALASGFCSLMNIGHLSSTAAGSNSAMWFPVKKGEEFTVHRATVSKAELSTVTLVPFKGAS